jgi:hypothetical protein
VSWARVRPLTTHPTAASVPERRSATQAPHPHVSSFGGALQFFWQHTAALTREVCEAVRR